MESHARQLREVKEAVIGPDRFQDLALVLRRAKTKETLLWAGGRWDRLERRFSTVDPDQVAVIDLEESQVAFTLWFADFLADYREGYPRDISLALIAGDRRGGKTFDALCCTLAALVDVPLLPDGMPAIGWAISRTYRERDELTQQIVGYIPQTFYRHQAAPEHRFTFGHGSYLRNLSADDPDSLKQGRVDWLFYNEPQKMSPRAIKNGLYGTSDRGGLTVLAANPPPPGEAEWLIDLKEGIEEDPEIAPIARFFNFESRLNTKIDQPARKRVAKLARKIDPDGADADAEGRWVRWGDLAYPAWNKRALDKGGLVGPIPELGAVDVTENITRKMFGRPYRFIVGGDFQRRPEAAVILKIFHGPDGPIYWFLDDIGVKGTEVELSNEVMGRRYVIGGEEQIVEPSTALWIGDCSGSYQGAERIRGRTSFTLLEEQGWRIEAAEVIKIPGKSAHPKNPDVPQRLGLAERLMQSKRWRVAPRASWLIEASSKCQMRKTDYGRRVPKGQWAHVTDAACYPVWRLEPKPTRPGGKGVRGQSFPGQRLGSGTYEGY
jgi:hypothetical protein